MSVSIAREKLIACLREKGFKYKRRSRRGHVEIWRQSGTGQRIDVRRRDLLPEAYVRTVLNQAGFTAAEVDEFFRKTSKD